MIVNDHGCRVQTLKSSRRRCTRRASGTYEVGPHIVLFDPDLEVEHSAKINGHSAVNATETMRRPVRNHPLAFHFRHGLRSGSG